MDKNKGLPIGIKETTKFPTPPDSDSIKKIEEFLSLLSNEDNKEIIQKIQVLLKKLKEEKNIKDKVDKTISTEESPEDLPSERLYFSMPKENGDFKNENVYEAGEERARKRCFFYIEKKKNNTGLLYLNIEAVKENYNRLYNRYHAIIPEIYWAKFSDDEKSPTNKDFENENFEIKEIKPLKMFLSSDGIWRASNSMEQGFIYFKDKNSSLYF